MSSQCYKTLLNEDKTLNNISSQDSAKEMSGATVAQVTYDLESALVHVYEVMHRVSCGVLINYN